jgi:hypothetical protein
VRRLCQNERADFFDHKEESTAPTLIYIFFYFLPFQNSTSSKLKNWLALTVLFRKKVIKTIFIKKLFKLVENIHHKKSGQTLSSFL